jgi:uncharacterized membrane protein YfcA
MLTVSRNESIAALIISVILIIVGMILHRRTKDMKRLTVDKEHKLGKAFIIIGAIGGIISGLMLVMKMRKGSYQTLSDMLDY